MSLHHPSTKRHSLRRQLQALRFWDSSNAPSSQSIDNPPRQLSPGDRLPYEIVLSILEHFYFSSDLYRQAFPYLTECPAFVYNRNIVDQPDPAQITLAGTLRVSRVWCLSGTALLYARPFLISFERVRQFARTIRDSPFLAPLVKELFVLNQRKAGAQKSFARAIKARGTAISVRSELISVLGSLCSLKELTVSTREGGAETILPLDTTFFNHESIGNSLRRLVIYGTPDSSPSHGHCISSSVNLPNLEVLCLREVFFQTRHQFPFLPRLQILQIAQCSHAYDPLSKTIPYSLFPCLTTLELYQNYSIIEPDAECFRKLSRLHLVGHHEFGYSDKWQYKPPMDNVKYLVLGHYFAPGKLVTIKLPRRLETLVFLLKFPVDYSRPPKIQTIMVRDLYLSLDTLFKKCERLRRVVVVGSLLSGGDTSELASILEMIDDFCTSRGITFRARTGMYMGFTSTQNNSEMTMSYVDCDNWVTSRLVRLRLSGV